MKMLIFAFLVVASSQVFAESNQLVKAKNGTWSAGDCLISAAQTMTKAEKILVGNEGDSSAQLQAAELVYNSMEEINFQVMKNGRLLFSTANQTVRRNHNGCIDAHQSLSKYLSKIPGGVEEYIKSDNM